MGEQLYNGIDLPDAWPPRYDDDGSTEPLGVPYLEAPPEVIPVDVGRQLFVDDFLIDHTTLNRRFHRARVDPISPVLKPQTDEEMDQGYCPVAAPFNGGVWYDPERRQFRMWYMPGWFHTTATAVSHDGLHWQRPELDVHEGSNLVWPPRPGWQRDGCLVWLDHDTPDPSTRWRMFQFYRYPGGEDGFLHTSPDGIHWSDPVTTNAVGDNTSFFYNPFRKKWVMSIRRGSAASGLRSRFYHEADTFEGLARWDVETEEVFWQRTDRLDLPDPTRPDHNVALYDLNVTPYESLMLGMFAVFRGPENDICAREGVPKLIDLEWGTSRDGFHFSRPCREPLIASSRREGRWDRAYLHAVGGVCLVVGEELWFYVTGFSGQSPRLGPGEFAPGGHSRNRMYAGGSVGLATLRRDGFASMQADSAGGTLVTRPLRFKGGRLFVNTCTSGGSLVVSVIGLDGRPVEGLTAHDCIPVCLDSTCTEVTWRSGKTPATVAGQPVQLKFDLSAGELYAFWLTDDPAGASHGYVAAGGPGFAGNRDLPR